MIAPKIHRLAEMFPPLKGEDFDALVKDIAAHGQREPIVLLDGKVLDGRNRLRACEAAKLKPRFREATRIEASDPVAFVVSANSMRRHLTVEQRAAIAVDVLEEYERASKVRQVEGQRSGGRGRKKTLGSADPKVSPDARKSTAQAGASLGVSGGSVARAKSVKAKAPELHAAIKAGVISVSGAARLSKRPEHERRAALKMIIDGEANNAQQAEHELDRLARAAIAVPSSTASLVLVGDAVEHLRSLDRRPHCAIMDPPYGIDVHRTREGGKDYADGEDYALSLLRDVASELVRVLADDAHLYVFSGYTYVHAFKTILGEFFDVQDNPIIWVKSRHTMCDVAQWYPNKHEYVLFAKQRGSKRKLDRCVPDVIDCALRKESAHSAEKPIELLRTFVSQSTVPGEIIIDPFAGSGSTGVAALGLGRDFIGIELDDKWAAEARARLAGAA